MISEIKNIFLDRKIVSLYDLSLHFDIDETAMEKMLEILIKKDFIRKLESSCSSNACSSCTISSCNSSKLVYYKLNSQ